MTISVLHMGEDPQTHACVASALHGPASPFKLDQVTSHSAFENALGALRDRRYALVLADLPAFGYETAQMLACLRAADPAVPVLLLSAPRSAAEAVGVMGWAGVEYVPLPAGQLGCLPELIDAVLRRTRSAAAAQPESKLQAFLAAMTDVVLVLDRDGRYLDIAPTNPALLFRPAVELINRTVHEVFPGSQADEFLAHIRRALERQETVEAEYTVTLQGRPFWFAASISPMAPDSVLWAARDITERKQAEAALRESEERYRLLVENAPEAIVLHRDRRILYINPAALRLFGVESPDAAIGRRLTDLLRLDGDAALADRVRQMEAAGLAYGPAEEMLRRADGQVIYLEIASVPVAYQGEPARQVIVRDVTERRRAQQALQESEELYRVLFSNSPVGLGLARLDGTLIAFNDAILRPGGYTREDIRHIGNVAGLYAEPDERAQVLATAQRLGYLNQHPVRLKRKDGAVYHALLSLRPVAYQGNACWQAVVEDVTGRIQAEDAIRQSEGQYRMLFEENPNPMWVCDRESLAFLAVNQAAVRHYGYSGEEFSDMTLLDIRPAADRAEPAPGVRSFQEHLAGRFGRVGTARHQKKDGTLIDVELSGGTILFLGRPAMLILVNDVTEQKRAQAALKESEEKWRLLVENVPDYILTLNPDATIQFVNRVAPGFSGEAMVGQSFYSYAPPSSQEQLQDVIGRVLQQGETVMYEVEGFGAHGQPAWYVARAGPLRKDGQVVGAIVISTDISERRRAEAERQNLFEQVRQVNERLHALSHKLIDAQENERRRLALELHDEIGQALTAVKISLKSLQGRLGPHAPGLDESMAIIEAALSQVRDLSLDLRPSLLDDLGLEAALRWYVDRQARRTGIRAHLEVYEPAGRLPPAVETACFRIAQEALTNVARHAHAREVMIELREEGDQLLLVVADDGVGFDPQSRRAARGQSLGLLGMQERASLIGGELDVDSAPGRGTEIRVWLPVRRSY